jgi:hypothetical protein
MISIVLDTAAILVAGVKGDSLIMCIAVFNPLAAALLSYAIGKVMGQ